jgi:hypothetical protein
MRKIQEIYWLAEELSDSYDELFSVDLLSQSENEKSIWCYCSFAGLVPIRTSPS